LLLIIKLVHTMQDLKNQNQKKCGGIYKKNLNKIFKAFTFVELAIVMIIIALLVFAVIGGKNLIESARTSRLIAEVSDYKVGLNVFYDKYNAYPGDIRKGRGSGVFGSVDKHGNIVHYGNGDGLIGGSDYTHQESASFFHHLYLAGVVDTAFNGVAPTNISEVETGSTNYPETTYDENTFYYVTIDDVDGRYVVTTSKLVVGSAELASLNSMAPVDAERADTQMDDGNPFTGSVVAHNAELTNGTLEFDGGCTTLYGYNTANTDKACILETTLTGDPVEIDSSIYASNPNFGDLGATEGTNFGDGTVNDCRLESTKTTGHEKAKGWAKNNPGDVIKKGTVVEAECDAGYMGHPGITCSNAVWKVSLVDVCTAINYCLSPAIGEAGYDDIVAWTNITKKPHVPVENPGVDIVGGQIEGTCDFGFAGFPQTTCASDSTWGPLTEACDDTGCASAPCTTDPTNFYCGDSLNCTSGTCCNNTINVSSPGRIIGDCYQGCTGKNFGDDTITNASLTAHGDCSLSCSGTFGNDTIINPRTANGDCGGDCSGTMGNDTIINASQSAHGDCYGYCSGIMGNDILINTGQFTSGDCYQECTGIVQWATDIFRYTVSNTSQIGDFNGGGVDDKIELPSGTTISIATVSTYMKTLTYSGSISGTLTISCTNVGDPEHDHDCDAGGKWAVKPCNIYIDGVQQTSVPGADRGSCTFND
jgi:hypothetical protein